MKADGGAREFLRGGTGETRTGDDSRGSSRKFNRRTGLIWYMFLNREEGRLSFTHNVREFRGKISVDPGRTERTSPWAVPFIVLQDF